MLETFEAADVFEDPSDYDQRDDLVLLRDFSSVGVCEGKYQQDHLVEEDDAKRCINRMEQATIEALKNCLWDLRQHIDYRHEQQMSKKPHCCQTDNTGVEPLFLR